MIDETEETNKLRTTFVTDSLKRKKYYDLIVEFANSGMFARKSPIVQTILRERGKPTVRKTLASRKRPFCGFPDSLLRV